MASNDKVILPSNAMLRRHEKPGEPHLCEKQERKRQNYEYAGALEVSAAMQGTGIGYCPEMI